MYMYVWFYGFLWLWVIVGCRMSHCRMERRRLRLIVQGDSPSGLSPGILQGTHTRTHMPIMSIPCSLHTKCTITQHVRVHVQCFTAVVHLCSLREDQYDVLTVCDWGQRLSYYYLNGKQVSSVQCTTHL